MSVSSLVVAALPIPLAATGTIAVFAEQKGIFAACSSLFCFLVLGFIFYMRHALASWMFPRGVSQLGVASASVLRGSASEGEAGQVARRHQRAKRAARLSKSVVISVLPLVLIGASSFFAISYYNTLDATVSLIAHSLEYPDPGGKNAGGFEFKPFRRIGGCQIPAKSEILNDSYVVPHSPLLLVEYVAMFACAEAAFIVMATREYMQDLLRLSDAELIAGEDDWVG